MGRRKGCRTMGAALAGSTIYSNVNQFQIGEKLQGGPPLGTGYYKAKYTGRNFKTRVGDGKNRNYIFCMNRMGGVGRGRSQFNVAGVNHPDGTRPCTPYRWSKPKPLATVVEAVQNTISGDPDAVQEAGAQYGYGFFA